MDLLLIVNTADGYMLEVHYNKNSNNDKLC